MKPYFIIVFVLGLLYSSVLCQSPVSADSTSPKVESFSVKDLDVRDVIRSLATKYNMNIFVDNSINQRVTLHLVNETVDNIIKFIVSENNLRLQKQGNIYKILPPEKPVIKPKEIQVEVKNDLLSVDLDNDDIKQTIRAISQKSGKTILLDQSASGKVSGLIQNLPFETGLRSLLENNGFRLRKNKSIYTVEREYVPYQDGKEGNKSGRGFYLIIEDSLVTLDVQNASINQIVQEAARRLNKNIFLYGKIEGQVSVRAEKQEFLQLLNLLFQGSDYTYKIQSGVILIGNKSVKGIATSEMIKLNYLKAEKVMEVLPTEIRNKAEINAIIEQNGIMVIGTRSVIDEIKEYVRIIDQPSPQILIETLVIDMNDSNIRDVGVNVGYGGQYSDTTSTTSSGINTLLPGIDVMFNGKEINNVLDKAGNLLGVSKIGRLPVDFYMQVKALETRGVLQVHSRPQIATLNGYEADISIGTTQYYKLTTNTAVPGANQLYVNETENFQTIEANISLKIIPWVSGSGEITVEIHPEFKTPVGQLSPEVPPTIQSRTLNSTVRLKDGETIVLGGLVQNSVEEYNNGTPYLSRIPILGNLFKSKGHNISKTQLLIYVTPHLYYGDE